MLFFKQYKSVIIDKPPTFLPGIVWRHDTTIDEVLHNVKYCSLKFGILIKKDLNFRLKFYFKIKNINFDDNGKYIFNFAKLRTNIV